MGDGHDVIVLTRSRSNATDLPNAIEVVEGDITDKSNFRDEMAGVDAVFHLAAWFQIGPGPWNEDKAEHINVEGTRNVLEVMHELDVPKGVYASTVGVYGNTASEYVDESHRSPTDFPSIYQETKWRAHYEVAEPMVDEGLPLVITTLGAIYGPGNKAYGGTPRTAFQGHLTQELPMIPDEFVLPWDYVKDTAANLYRAMDEGNPGEEYILARSFELFRSQLVDTDRDATDPGNLERSIRDESPANRSFDFGRISRLREDNFHLACQIDSHPEHTAVIEVGNGALALTEGIQG
ncbi:NAD-dependent epimerase/dehydratase family protein [Halodesulfurarchaeum sp.]|uniref:NAD-dependent epimerase/dehydratase family protein n=1 Tax=Halodesulfurarchaeum sp. TaxID=1980530 RepID=UPI002FC38A6C